MNYEEIYNKDYYSSYGHHKTEYITDKWLMGNFKLLAFSLKNKFPDVKTHLDVGCAAGFLVKNMREVGIESTGVDLPYIIGSTNVEGLHAYDLTRIYLPHVLPHKKYDLVTCIEVAEHIYPEDENELFVNLRNLTGKYLMFSSDSNDVSEPTHVNVNDAGYWSARLKVNGFIPIPESYRPIPWAMFFRKA